MDKLPSIVSPSATKAIETLIIPASGETVISEYIFPPDQVYGLIISGVIHWVEKSFMGDRHSYADACYSANSSQGFRNKLSFSEPHLHFATLGPFTITTPPLKEDRNMHTYLLPLQFPVASPLGARLENPFPDPKFKGMYTINDFVITGTLTIQIIRPADLQKYFPVQEHPKTQVAPPRTRVGAQSVISNKIDESSQPAPHPASTQEGSNISPLITTGSEKMGEERFQRIKIEREDKLRRE